MHNRFFKKFLNTQDESVPIPPLDGEILYSTNNVCVHPSSLLSNSSVHHSGFLTITAKVKKNVFSLELTWVPNSSKQIFEDKNQPSDVGGMQIEMKSSSGQTDVSKGCSPSLVANTHKDKISRISEGLSSPETFSFHTLENLDVNELEGDDAKLFSKDGDKIILEDNLDVYETVDKSKYPQAVHNFEFPENSIRFQKENVTYQGYVIRPPRNQAFGAFKVNLAHMRSLRLYFRDKNSTSGEFIIASRESQYKVLHFHKGGLDCVAMVLKEWKTNLLANKICLKNLSINHFSVVHSDLTQDSCHPEEGLYRSLTGDAWSLSIDEFGRVQNQQNIQKAVFFGGVEKELRPAVWPFLLKFYKFDSTGIERNELQLRKLGKYGRINEEREKLMNEEEMDNFIKNVACSVEKDVLRTDRTNPFYRGEGNPNLITLQRILLNYSVHTKTAYTQGMSDLLAPLLMEMQEESNVFWCFVGLMQRTIFISSPSDHEMEKQLLYLRELLRILLPNFHAQLAACGIGAYELLFAHRWILLCFKREFSESEALMIWEACWAHYQTNYFHLFVCVAIIALYGVDVAENNLASDEMLLHFSHLALQMNGLLVLKKARGLLHTVRISNNVPCTLCDLFYLPTDTGEIHQMPVIRCAKTAQCVNGCPYERRCNQVQPTRFTLKKLFQ